MTLVAKSDQSTGNPLFASYALQSHELVFAFTAPYSRRAPRPDGAPPPPLPGYSQDAAYEFLAAHGLAARAVGARPAPCRAQAVAAHRRRKPRSSRTSTAPGVAAWRQRARPKPLPSPLAPAAPGLLVDDAAEAYAQATANGGAGVLPPTAIADCEGGAGGSAVVSEVKLYGDVVLRFVSGDYKVGGQRHLAGLWGRARAGPGAWPRAGLGMHLGSAPKRLPRHQVPTAARAAQ